MEHYLATHFPLLLKVSGQAAVLIVLVLALQRAFARQLKPRWRYALWLLVMFRLALPWTISSSASVFNLFKFSHAAAWKFDFSRHFTDPRGTAAAAAAEGSATAAAQKPAAGVPPTDPVLRGALGIWATGVFALATWLLITHLRLLRRISRHRALTDAAVLGLLEDCKQQMGVRTPVMVVETPEVGSPGLFGFVRPRLLLPTGLTRNFSPEELRYVFLHELAHIKRNDIFAAWLMAALQILHWFNPLVWFAAYRIRVDRELACDALALSYARDEENQPYGQTIIKLLENFGRSAWAPSMAGAVESKNQLKERIRMIAKYRKTNRGFTLAVALFAGLGLVTLTDAKTGAAELAKEILGTWELVGAPDGPGAAPAEGARYKTFSNGTFQVTQAAPDTGASIDHHGGSYTLEGDKLTESVKFADGLGMSGIRKKSFTFKIKVEGDTYTQIGISNSFNEIWKRVESEAPKPRKISTDALQGTWRDPDTGVLFAIHGSTLEFHEANTNQWIKASFLLYDTEPKQIAAVITGCFDTNAVGAAAFGIYEVKDGTLTLSGFSPGFPVVPESFDTSGARKIVLTKK